MKFTLKDYQTDAVRDTLTNLRKARKRWHEEQERNAFSLTAATGAGKTVMAASVFEALFHGDDALEFDADPGAVVIWFSDSPDLNEQTRFRLMEASDRLSHSDMVVVENSFNRPKFKAKKIYFLNTQKLSKKSLLVRGSEGDEDGQFPEMRPDLRSFTIWDTIRNTVEDPAVTLYLVLDEAHRGMKVANARAQNERTTLVQQLVNGAGSVPPLPVVWGISATVERFNKAMEVAQGRTRMADVKVDVSKVQESGLLKDTIVLDIPDEDEPGQFDTVLGRRATDTLKEVTELWADYARHQSNAKEVVPLMVLQVANTPEAADIARALHAIVNRWPELRRDSIANVFGEHRQEIFGDFTVPYIEPQRVQEATWVRVLIAKDAISTGWDCPRAEVMVSFRAASDRTHITQLLGRMVRSPLARRIPGDERLNSVHCLLPRFDTKTVQEVVEALTSGGDDTGPPPTGRVLINPALMMRHPDASEVLWEKFESLPSNSRPQRGAKPPRRLTALAHELAWDHLLENAGQKAHAEMHKALDAVRARYKDEIAAKRAAMMTIDGHSLVVDLRGQTKTFDQFWEEADTAVIDEAYRRAARLISPDIARTYTDTLAARTNPSDQDAFVDALMEARVEVAALGLVPDVQVYFDAEADKLAKAWLSEYRVVIKGLSHDRQEAYRAVREMSREPQGVELLRPEGRLEPSAFLEGGIVTALPTYQQHLMCDADHNYPVELNAWEQKVVKSESRRQDFGFWYRNPQQPGHSSLGIAYVGKNELGSDEYKIVRPDFIFFAAQADGTVAADLVDPHGLYLADALAKLKGLALYAEAHSDSYRRIESIAEVNGVLRVLDLTRADVQRDIAQATDVGTLYSGPLANDYL